MLRESFWWPKIHNNVEDLVKTSPFCQAVTPFTIQATQPNIHAVAPMEIFIHGDMWPISNGWIHIYCRWCLFQVPRHSKSLPLLNNTANLSHQEKAKQIDTIPKMKSKTRYDKTMNVKIFDIKVGDKILAKQWKQSKLTTLYKSEPFTVIEKKGNTVKIRYAYGNKCVQKKKQMCIVFRKNLILSIRCQSHKARQS